MGGSNSKADDDEGKNNKKSSSEDKASSFLRTLKGNVEDEMARRAMMQREVQMAVSIAQARDTLHVFGPVWAAYAAGVGFAKAVAKKPVPAAAAVPVVVGAIVLGNVADLAYGNKLQRVTKEAEHLLEEERGRFVPLRQAPFAKFYTPEDRAYLYDRSTAVGELYPSAMFLPRRATTSEQQSEQ